MAAATYQAEQMGRRKGFDKEPSSKTIIHGHGYSIYLYLYIYTVLYLAHALLTWTYGDHPYQSPCRSSLSSCRSTGFFGDHTAHRSRGPAPPAPTHAGAIGSPRPKTPKTPKAPKTPTSPQSPQSEARGRWMGRWDLGESLGRGGMGNNMAQHFGKRGAVADSY